MRGDDKPISNYPLIGEDTAAADEDVFLYGPPGTGKTTQLKRRLHGVFRETDRKLSDYTVVTYRRSQAEEMITEFSMEGWLPELSTKAPARGETRYVGTLHGVCRRIIEDDFSASRYREVFGSDTPSVASGKHRREWCDKNDIAYHPRISEDTAGELLYKVWSWSRQNWPVLVDEDEPRFDDLPSEVQRHVMMRSPGWDSLRRTWRGDPVLVYQKYRDWLYQEGLQDFDDMLETVLAHGLTPSTDGLVIDEAHDLNPIMLSVLMMWANDVDHILIAGDQDQIINRFDGARRSLYTQIPDHLNIPTVVLKRSHRLHPRIWTAAESMLQNAHETPPVKPVNTDADGIVEVRESPTFSPKWHGQTWANNNTPTPKEKNSPTDLYQEFVTEGPYGDIMMLTRTRVQAEGVMYALDRVGIPYVTQSGLRGWKTPLNDNPSTDATRASVYRLCLLMSNIDPSTATDRNTIRQSSGEAVSDVTLGHDHVDVLTQYCPMEFVDAGSRSEFSEYRHLADPTMDAEKLPLTHEGWMKLTEDPINVLETLNRWYQSSQEKKSVKNAIERGASISPQRLKVMTIHASKGSESDVAIVYDGITSRVRDGIQDDSEARKNEYRTWYVALSRARERLCVMRGAWGMNTMSIIPKDFDRRIVSESIRQYQT